MGQILAKTVHSIEAYEFGFIPKRTWVGAGIAFRIFMRYTRWPAVQGESEILTLLASGAPNMFTKLVSRSG